MEYIELPMKKTIYKSNIGNAGILSVLNSDEYTGKVNVRISKLCFESGDIIYNYFKSNEHEVIVKGINIQVNENCMQFSSNKYEENKFVYIQKTIDFDNQTCGRLEMILDFIQDANAQSFIKLLISKGNRNYNKKTCEMLFSDECSIKVTAKGNIIFHYKSIYKRVKNNFINGKMNLRLAIEWGNEIKTLYSLDGKDWEILWKTKSKIKGKREIGIYINPRVNPFFYEFYSTQLQLCYSLLTKCITTQPIFNEKNFVNSIDLYNIPKDVLPIENRVIEYYISLLSQNYYIRTRLDEYYVPERFAYKKKHYAHPNYIYGVDKNKKEFLLMGFNRIMVLSTIKFDEFLLAEKYDNSGTDKITICRYNSRNNPKNINLKFLIVMLKSYLKGQNCYGITGGKIIYDFDNNTLVFGIKIFDCFINNSNEMEILINDVRIINEICEHYIIIINLLKLLLGIKVLNFIEYNKLYFKFELLSGESENIKGVLLSNKTRNIKNIKSYLNERLEKLQIKDFEATKELINVLIKKNLNFE